AATPVLLLLQLVLLPVYLGLILGAQSVVVVEVRPFVEAFLLFGNLINRIGGFRVAIACLSVEVLGLLLLWLAPDAQLALAGAALSGFGFSLVFPALGVEAVNLVPASSRGSAVGAYSLFIDLSLGITGPLAGAVAAGFGFASIFLFAALAALGGLLLSVYLYRQAPKARKARDA
ncbi:MFS transporter, partial [Pseudomonas sp. TNT11]